MVPIKRTRSWDDVKAFARAIAEEVVDAAPDVLTTNPLRRARRGKIFVDYLRNARGATAVAAYSTRARSTAPVSTPLGWAELAPTLRAGQYTVLNLRARLSRLKRDPWAGFFAVRQEVTRTMLRG